MLKRPKNKAKNQSQYCFCGDIFKWKKPVLAFDVTSCSVPFWMPKSNLFSIGDGFWYLYTWKITVKNIYFTICQSISQIM